MYQNQINLNTFPNLNQKNKQLVVLQNNNQRKFQVCLVKEKLNNKLIQQIY